MHFHRIGKETGPYPRTPISSLRLAIPRTYGVSVAFVNISVNTWSSTDDILSSHLTPRRVMNAMTSAGLQRRGAAFLVRHPTS